MNKHNPNRLRVRGKISALASTAALLVSLPIAGVWAAEAPLRSIRADVARPDGIMLRIDGNTNCAGWPVKGGVPFARGVLREIAQLSLTTAAGTPVAFNATVANRWLDDDSIKWILLDTVVPEGLGGACLNLSVASASNAPAHPAGGWLAGWWRRLTGVGQSGHLMVADTGRRIVVDTGALRAEVSKRHFNLLDHLAGAGRDLIARPGASGAGAYMEDEAGVRYYASNDAEATVVVEENNPLRACIRAAGWHVAESGARLGRFVTRLHFYRDQPFIRVFHTFIITENSQDRRYRDIGVRLPLAGAMESCGFDTDARLVEVLASDAAPYLVQYTAETNLFFNGAHASAGRHADGWLYARTRAGAALAIIARDFRQQFPKELAVADNALTYHLWPRHGRPRTVVTPDTISPDNALQSWNVHEGELLDFTYPDFYLECFAGMRAATKFGAEMQQAFDLAPQINALGVAKTHEFIVWCGGNDAAAGAVPRLSGYLNNPPVLTPDPAWVARTRVLGPIGVVDRVRRPEIEEFFDSGAQSALAVRDLLGDYGMFNFGDTHHAIDLRARKVVPYRYWYNTHHNMPRWAWLQFARTGDPRCLTWGTANIRHVMDMDHCHYTTPAAEAQADFRLRKRLGGVCDYKGLAHWSAGGRFCYNSVADALLNYYYITGDRRGRDVALLHGQGILANPPRPEGREGAGISASLIALYEETQELAYKVLLEKFVAGMLATQNADGMLVGRAPHWTPWLERYIELTDDDAAKRALVRWADYFMRQDEAVEWKRMGSYFNLFAHAWRVTGDEQYLRYAGRKLAALVVKARVSQSPFGADWPVTHFNPPAANCWNAVFIPDLLGALDECGMPDPMIGFAEDRENN